MDGYIRLIKLAMMLTNSKINCDLTCNPMFPDIADNIGKKEAIKMCTLIKFLNLDIPTPTMNSSKRVIDIAYC